MFVQLSNLGGIFGAAFRGYLPGPSRDAIEKALEKILPEFKFSPSTSTDSNLYYLCSNVPKGPYKGIEAKLSVDLKSFRELPPSTEGTFPRRLARFFGSERRMIPHFDFNLFAYSPNQTILSNASYAFLMFRHKKLGIKSMKLPPEEDGLQDVHLAAQLAEFSLENYLLSLNGQPPASRRQVFFFKNHKGKPLPGLPLISYPFAELMRRYSSLHLPQGPAI